MTLQEERHLPQAKQTLKGIRGHSGDERQVIIEDTYWYCFRMTDKHWQVMDSDTFINDDYLKTPLPKKDLRKRQKSAA